MISFSANYCSQLLKKKKNRKTIQQDLNTNALKAFVSIYIEPRPFDNAMGMSLNKFVLIMDCSPASLRWCTYISTKK